MSLHWFSPIHFFWQNKNLPLWDVATINTLFHKCTSEEIKCKAEMTKSWGWRFWLFLSSVIQIVFIILMEYCLPFYISMCSVYISVFLFCFYFVFCKQVYLIEDAWEILGEGFRQGVSRNVEDKSPVLIFLINN